MYEVTTHNGDYQIEKFDSLEAAQAFARKMVDEGWFRVCRIYHDNWRIETIAESA